MKYIKAFIAVVILIILDQISKGYAVSLLKGNDGITVIPGVFRLYYLENRGSAFGMMQNQQLFFAVFTVAVLLVIAWIYIKMPETVRMLPLRLVSIAIFAGAIGNFIDRIKQSYVVDFFYFELINFPVFNVADIFVTCGAFVLVVLILFYYKDEDLAFLSLKKKEK